MVHIIDTGLLKLTPWRLIFLEKPTVSELHKKFPEFFASRRFSAVYTRAPATGPLP
jgi:hypothetical protein